MTKTETLQRVMIYIDETDRYQGVNLSGAILERLRKEGVSGATVMRGTAGFGRHGTVHTTAVLDLAIALPEVITFIDTEERVKQVLPRLDEMIREGLIVVDDVQAIKISNAKKALDDRDTSERKAAQAATAQLQVEAEHHKVSDYMDRNPLKVKPEQKVEEIIALMIKNGRALLPVVSDDGNLLGAVLSEDLLTNMLDLPQGGFHFFGLRGSDQKRLSLNIKGQTASQVMRSAPLVVQEDTSMYNAAKLMITQKIKAIPVVQGQKLVGVLRLPDVLKIALEIDCQ